MITVAGKHSLFVGSVASLVEDDREVAWAERHVKNNPFYKWVIGRYVEADTPNLNGHLFPLAELQANLHTLDNAPMNMLHRAHHVVGSFAAADMIYPEHEGAATQTAPHAEALAAFWRFYFEDEYNAIEKAYKEGSLFFSMEAIPRAFTCVDPTCAGKEYEYAGRTSPTYCAHLNEAKSVKTLMGPQFVGGALIIPPTMPGWSNAGITELGGLIERNLAEAELTYAQLSVDMSHLEPAQWEHTMGQILLHMEMTAEAELARKFNADERKKLADKGHAMSDGSFPIDNASDLKNAIQAVGRARDIAKAKSHIKKRAKEMGLEKLLPAGW